MSKRATSTSRMGRAEAARRNRSLLLAGLAVVLGTMVLVGWALGVPLLTRLLPTSPPMQPLAAIGFVLAGLAVHLHAARRFRAAALPIAALTVIAGAAFLQYLTGASFGVDALVMREAVLAQAGNPYPGRMYLISAVEFLLLCLCLVLPRGRTRQYRRVGRLATLGLAIACASLSGYVLNTHGFAATGSFVLMAAPTAVGLILLFGAILQAQRGRTWLLLVRSRSPGGEVVRSLLPLILGWPLALGALINLFAPALGDPRQAIALTMVFVMAVQAVIVLRFALGFERTATAQEAADRGRRHADARYRSVVETVTEGIITIDAAGNIVFANPAAARLFGYSVAELEAARLTMLMPAAARQPFLAALADYLASGRKHIPWSNAEVRGLHRSGQEFPIETSYAEVRVNGQRLITGIVRDISERKRAEAELRELNLTLDRRVRERTLELSRSNEALMRSNLDLQRFVYIASHDLQTPLRSISGFVQLLQQNYTGRLDPQADSWIRLVVENAHRLQLLIQDMLDYSRVDAQALPFEPTDFRRIFDEVAAALAGPIRETGARLTCGELPVVMGDRMQLQQVLQHLIDNAIKYHGEAPPRVEVAAEHREGEWLISVRDNGIGIAARHHEAIFELFRRLHTLQAYPGTGIGLAVCRRIIHRHGGRIWVESEPGKGAVFHFTLPVPRAQPPAGAAQA